MKRSQLLAISVVALMVLAAVPTQEVRAATPYTEKLSVYVAGSSALWYFTFSAVNGSGRLSAFESTPGLSWYNITAIETTGWVSDFQVFGAQGYGVLPVPYVPSQGLFLTLGSDSFADASAAASTLGAYFFTSFTSLSNGTGTFSFYSPVSFDKLVPATLLTFLPTSEGGFTDALSASSFVSTSSPFVVLGGVSGPSGFDHSLVVGSIASPALSSSEPDIMSYFGGSVSSLTASNQSSSSVVQINFLGGEVESTDPGAVVANPAGGNGSYTLALAPGESIAGVNATVVQLPTPLLATRSVDKGVLKTGDNITVTLTLKDLSPSVSVTNVAFSDNWWTGSGAFVFLNGNSTESGQGIGPGQYVTPDYRLEYTGTGTGSAVIPASAVSYQYQVNGATFNATAVLNPIRLSLGADDAVVYATLTPTGSFGEVVGRSQGFTLTAINVGTLPASSVAVAGHSFGLAPGAASNVTLSQSATGLTGTNITQSYLVTYLDPAGTQLSASTNVVSDVFSQSSMNIAFPTLATSAQLGALANQGTNLTITYTTANLGTANVASFEAEGTLPQALGCGTVRGEGISCSDGVVTIRYATVDASSTQSAYMVYNITSPLDYILAPLTFNGTASGIGVTGTSNPVAVPAGVLVSKQFAPAQLFGGMNSTVTVRATNSGPFPAYGATVASTVDTFDSLSTSAVTTKTTASIVAGGNTTLSYGVTLQKVSGTQAGAVATATFYLAGTSFTIDSPAPNLVVYQPLGVAITTAPASPEEGKAFMINFVITNPTDVQVSDVRFTLPLPSGLALSQLVNAQVSSRVLTVYAGALGPGANVTASATAVAGSGITVPFKKAELTFSYEGFTIHGTVPASSGIGIAENVFVRYVIPTAIIILATLGVAFYVRRRSATVPASPK